MPLGLGTLPSTPPLHASTHPPTNATKPQTGIQKLRCTCQLDCTEAPADDRLAYPPYAIHNFGWKAGSSNNDVLLRERDGNFTERLDLKAISVSARESLCFSYCPSPRPAALVCQAQHMHGCRPAARQPTHTHT